jgi:hypothetical protein
MRFDGAGAAPKERGDLTDGPIIEVVQRDHCPLPGRQRQQRPVHVQPINVRFTIRS